MIFNCFNITWDSSACMYESNTFDYYLCNCIDNNSQWTYENRECIRP